MNSSFKNPIEELIHSTVRIECDLGNGATSTGSGYFYLFFDDEDKKVPVIVTNKHVVQGAVKASINLTKSDAGRPKLGEFSTFVIDDFENQCIFHSEDNVDLAIFPIAPLLSQAEASGDEFYYVPLGKSAIATTELLSTLSSMEDIVMIGYPNGIWDAIHNLPIIRRGITATHPKLDYNGKPEFVIDAACFPGSSGSPVFLANLGSFVDASGALCAGNRVAFLGTLYAGPVQKATGEVEVVEVPTNTKAISKTDLMLNLGYVIHASKLLDFEEKLRDLITPKAFVSRNSPCPCGSGAKFRACCGKVV
ncbi:trypsin-like peptidase domain-containing protein [Vibrio harveyi]|nr:trypsin-like peptidase domain-containing protein [Vibrio harveyi]